MKLGISFNIFLIFVLCYAQTSRDAGVCILENEFIWICEVGLYSEHEVDFVKASEDKNQNISLINVKNDELNNKWL